MPSPCMLFANFLSAIAGVGKRQPPTAFLALNFPCKIERRARRVQNRAFVFLFREPVKFPTWTRSLQFSDKIPLLPETISVEYLYQDHDERSMPLSR